MTLELRSRPLSASPLVALAGQHDTPTEWYEPRPDAEGWKRRVVETAAEFEGRAWLRALAPALDASGAAAERLQRVAGTGGVAVTTGQQPGLFGGPLYTWFKAMSALALADELEKRTGVPTAPVFWAATDDSDFAEASETTVSMPGGAEVIRIEAQAEEGRPRSAVPLGGLGAQLDALTRACGSAPNGAALDAVRAAYAPGATVGDAYVRLLRMILEPLGVAVLDASHPAVRAAGRPLLEQALAHGRELEAALKQRSKLLKDAGHRAQVAHVAGRTLVFSNGNGGRQRVRVREADALVGSNSVDLSPNVLLRPVMERAILPTVAYVGGPAEIAYFAQVSAVADGLGAKRPLIVPRWSGVIVEPHVRKVLDRIGADVDDFADPHAVETRVAREQLPAGIVKALEQARARVESALDELQVADTPADVLPPAVLEGAKRQLLHKLDRLERRYVAATKRQGSELLTEVGTARGALYPDGKPQERALNAIPLLAKYGDDVLTGILAKAREHAAAL
ncbi:MAG: bacillithiol biosynthesis cysteine-adding enzyme BshC [Gemmatimonadaceae bacterium]|nr:bacillithiol biosynthesis cysteine-adding enzyme BshC [Gemmatimonadaceae bacterium]